MKITFGWYALVYGVLEDGEISQKVLGYMRVRGNGKVYLARYAGQTGVAAENIKVEPYTVYLRPYGNMLSIGFTRKPDGWHVSTIDGTAKPDELGLLSVSPELREILEHLESRRQK